VRRGGDELASGLGPDSVEDEAESALVSPDANERPRLDLRLARPGRRGEDQREDDEEGAAQRSASYLRSSLNA
jgi:hypothetical protein